MDSAIARGPRRIGQRRRRAAGGVLRQRPAAAAEKTAAALRVQDVAAARVDPLSGIAFGLELRPDSLRRNGNDRVDMSVLGETTMILINCSYSVIRKWLATCAAALVLLAVPAISF